MAIGIRSRLSTKRGSSTIMNWLRRAALVCGISALGACADGYLAFPVSEAGQASLDDSLDIVRLTSENVGSWSAPTAPSPQTTLPQNSGWTYLVGPGDVLDVIVFDNPELTNPTGQRDARSGFRVQRDGTIFYPFIGQVEAGGRGIDAVREEIATRLREFLPEPQVEVRVLDYNAQRVVVTGAVGQPARLPLTEVPMTLLDAVNEVGGISGNADASRVSVFRNGRAYNVNLARHLREGQPGDNPLVQNGDLVNVPVARPREVFLFGELRSPTAIRLEDTPVSLTQAIARSGGLAELRADARGIFVFRRDAERIRVFQLATATPAELVIGSAFVLEPDDVIFVTRSPQQRWNDTVRQLLPILDSPRRFRGLVEDTIQ